MTLFFPYDRGLKAGYNATRPLLLIDIIRMLIIPTFNALAHRRISKNVSRFQKSSLPPLPSSVII